MEERRRKKDVYGSPQEHWHGPFLTILSTLFNLAKRAGITSFGAKMVELRSLLASGPVAKLLSLSRGSWAATIMVGMKASPPLSLSLCHPAIFSGAVRDEILYEWQLKEQLASRKSHSTIYEPEGAPMLGDQPEEQYFGKEFSSHPPRRSRTAWRFLTVIKASCLE